MKVIFIRPTDFDVQPFFVNTAETPQEAYDICKRVYKWLAGYALVAVIDNSGEVVTRDHIQHNG